MSAVRLDIDSLPINIKILFFDLLGEIEGTEQLHFISCISFPQASPDWGIGSLGQCTLKLLINFTSIYNT